MPIRYRHTDPFLARDERNRRNAAEVAFRDALDVGADPAKLFAVAYDAGLSERDRVIPDREHLVQVKAADTAVLRSWLADPNGASALVGAPTQRAHLEAVTGGGILIRTSPFAYVEPYVPGRS